MTRLLIGLLSDTSIRIAVVAVLVAALLFMLRARAASVRHAAWTTVLCAMLAMPVLSSISPAIPVPAEVWAPWMGVTLEPPAVPPSPPTPAVVGVQTPSAAVILSAVQGARDPNVVRSPSAPIWPALVAALYGLGVLAFGLRLLIGLVALARFRRVGNHTEIPCLGPRIFASPLVCVPLTAGVLRPVIILPAIWSSWPRETLAAVLAHERAHMRRADPLVLLLARINRCVFWFHPLAWWLERHLATTAEHACDEAAVQAIGQPRRYAEVLLDMAAASHRGHGRPTWQGVGIDGAGLLSQRIDRILRGDLFRRVSRTRQVIVAIGCAAAIVIGVACRQQVTVAVLKEDPVVSARLARQKAQSEASDAAKNMTRAQVADLEAVVRKNPDDLESRRKLLIFYRWSGQTVLGWNETVAAARPHLLWLIAHHPEDDLSIFGPLTPAYDAVGYAEARKLWMAQTARADVTPAILGNAAFFFQPAEKPIAEALLLRARAMDPSGPTPRVKDNVYYSPWTDRLGVVYALTLVGSDDETLGNVVKSVNPKQAHSAYATRIRKTLDDSQDAALLASAGRYLVINAANAKTDFDRVALGKGYLERALALDPSSRARQTLEWQRNAMEHSQRWLALRDREAEIVGGEIAKKVKAGQPLTRAEQEALVAVEAQAVASMPDAERFAQLIELAGSNYMRAELKDSSNYPRDLLALADKFSADPRYGDAIYQAHLVLALNIRRNGDIPGAVAAMREALEANALTAGANNRQVLRQRLMVYLLQSGERESVADFLERSAKLDAPDRDQLLKDAAAIRAGQMPQSYQYMITR